MLIVELTTKECADLLARLSVGRLGCSREDQPYIVPFNFAYHERHLYSVTVPGQKIEWMRANPLVCVEADDIVDQNHWTSVVAQGRYEELPDTPEESADRRLAYALLQRRVMWWEPAGVRVSQHGAVESAMPIYYRIHIARMTGRRATPDPVARVAFLEPPPTSRWARLRNRLLRTPLAVGGTSSQWRPSVPRPSAGSSPPSGSSR